MRQLNSLVILTVFLSAGCGVVEEDMLLLDEGKSEKNATCIPDTCEGECYQGQCILNGQGCPTSVLYDGNMRIVEKPELNEIDGIPADPDAEVDPEVESCFGFFISDSEIFTHQNECADDQEALPVSAFNEAMGPAPQLRATDCGSEEIRMICVVRKALILDEDSKIVGHGTSRVLYDVCASPSQDPSK